MTTPADRLLASPTSSATISAGMNRRVPVVYGIDRRDALISSITDIGDKTLIVCIWSIGEIDAVTGLTINDEQPPDGTVVRHYTGTPTQGVDPALVALGSTDDMRATVGGHNIALAYSVIELPDSIGAPRIAATIRGRTVLDPRTGVTAWSDNPALILGDYISNPVYGTGRQVTGVEAAANACDELINGERRRTVGITVNVDDAPRLQWVDTLAAYAGCWVTNEGLVRKLIPDRPAAPVMTITDEDVLPDSLSLSRPGLADTPTVIRVEYTDTSAIPWRTAPGAVAKLTGVDDGSMQWVEEVVSLPGIHNGNQAAREAAQRRNTIQLADITASWAMFDDALALQTGDIVDLQLTEYAGLMRIVTVESGEPGRYTVTATKYDAAIYDDAATAVDLLPIPPVPRQDSVDQPNIGGVTSGNGIYIEGGDGTIHNRIRIDLSVPSDPRNFGRYEVRFRRAGSADAWQAGEVTGYTAYLFPVEDGVSYEYQVRTIGRLPGVVSDWVPGSHTVQPKDVPPPAPTGIDGSVNAAGMRRVSWQYGARPRDFAGFEIQYDAGDGWVDLITGHPGQRGLTQRQIVETGDMPAGNVTIRVRAVDTTGNASGWVSTTENFEQNPDGTWTDVNARIEAERLRNDNQDNSTIPAAQTQADNAWGKGVYLQDTVIPPIDTTATDAWNTGDWLKNTEVPPIKANATNAWGHATWQTGTKNPALDSADSANAGNISTERQRNDGQDSSLNAHDGRITTEKDRNDGQDGTLNNHEGEIQTLGLDVSTAQNTANNAQSTANAAQSTANSAISQAQQAQNDAANALQEAGLKARVYYQSYDPGGSEGDIWIHTGQAYHPYVKKSGYWQDATVLQANVVQATHINVSALSAITANLGTVTTGRLNFAGGGYVDLDAGWGSIVLQTGAVMIKDNEVLASGFRAYHPNFGQYFDITWWARQSFGADFNGVMDLRNSAVFRFNPWNTYIQDGRRFWNDHDPSCFLYAAIAQVMADRGYP